MGQDLAGIGVGWRDSHFAAMGRTIITVCIRTSTAISSSRSSRDPAVETGRSRLLSLTAVIREVAD